MIIVFIQPIQMSPFDLHTLNTVQIDIKLEPLHKWP